MYEKTLKFYVAAICNTSNHEEIKIKQGIYLGM